ncbi:MAG: acyl-CoA dehydrogenase family protein [Acidimicrobiia bacterium]
MTDTLSESTVTGDNADEARVRRLTEQLIADHASADEVTFLGAQFDAGLAWVHWPVGHGGLGLAPAHQGTIDTMLEAAGCRYSWLRNPMGIGMVGPTIAAVGTEEQKTAYLRRIFTAEDVWWQLFSEPGAGSDVATLATRAVLDGDEWIVNGQKVWTSAAHLARWGMLLARTNPDVPKHKGLTAFVLDMHAPGVEIRPLVQMSGEAHFNEVYLTDVRVPHSAMLGELGRGWDAAVTTLMNERVSIGGAVEAKGSGDIAAAVRAYQSRSDRTGAERDELMKLWTEAEVLRLGKVRAQQQREKGTPGPEGSILKLHGALLGQRIYAFTVDLLGAEGMMNEAGYKPRNRDLDRDDPIVSFLAVQSSTIAGGTSEIMRNILGERVLGLPAEPRNDRDVPWTAIPRGA